MLKRSTVSLTHLRPETRNTTYGSLPSNSSTVDLRRTRPSSALASPEPAQRCAHTLRIDGPSFANCGQCGVFLPDGDVTALRQPALQFCFEVGAHEVLEKMRGVQANCRPYTPEKPVYLRYRRVLVDWMCELGDEIKLQASTIHHAVACLDTYFSLVRDLKRNEESKKFLHLVAYTCIFFSAKYCEKDSRGPTATDISYLSRNAFKDKEIIKWETRILQTLDWNLLMATPIDYVKVYLGLGCVFSTDRVPGDTKLKL